MFVSLDDIIFELEKGVDFTVEEGEIVIVHVVKGSSKGCKLRDLLVQVFLVHKRIEKGGCIRSEGELFVELLKHLVK